MMINRKVPEIRGKGFLGDWRLSTVGAVSRLGNGRDYKGLESGDIPVYGTGGYMLSVNRALSYDTDAVGIGRKGTIDKPYVLKAPFWTVDTLFYITPEKSIDLAFFFASLLRIDWKSKNAATGLPSLTRSAISQSEISIPPTLDEQQAVGSVFKELDTLIDRHRKKHHVLHQAKASLLQRMFPQGAATEPELRMDGFEGKWETTTIGDQLTVSRGGSPRPIESFITTEHDGINWIKIGDVKQGHRYIVSTEEKIKPSGVKKSRRVFRGDLILSNSMSFGRPYVLKIDGCIHDGWLLIRDDHGSFDKNFLIDALSTNSMKRQYVALAAGGVVHNLNAEVVRRAQFKWPPTLSEQQAIGNVFSKLDELIAGEAQYVEKLAQAKTALLQKMFV